MNELKDKIEELKIRPVEKEETNVHWIGETYRTTINELYKNAHKQKMSSVLHELKDKPKKLKPTAKKGGKRKTNKNNKTKKRKN